MGWSFFKRRKPALKEAKSALPTWEEAASDCDARGLSFPNPVAEDLYSPKKDFRATPPFKV